MKKTFFVLVMIFLIVTVTVFGCKPATKEEVVAQENLEVAQENVVIAKREATEAEWKSFKVKSDALVHENELKIAKLKSDIKKTKNDVDIAYQKNIDALEQKNKELKLKIESYKNDANADWESFERESKYDMDELGKALKNLTVNNKK